MERLALVMLRVVNGLLLAAGLLKVAAAARLRDWLHYTFEAPLSAASVAAAALIAVEVTAGVIGLLSPRPAARAIGLLFAVLLGGHLLIVMHPEWGRCPCLGALDTGTGWSWGNASILVWCSLGVMLNARGMDVSPGGVTEHPGSGRRRLS